MRISAGSACLVCPCAHVRSFAEWGLSLVILTGSENEYCVQSAKLREHQEEEEGQRTIGSHHPREQVSQRPLLRLSPNNFVLQQTT